MSRPWTDEQRALFDLGPDGLPRLKRVAVSADAGAGKTSVLVERVRHLPADKRILCVSFTEKSKADLEERLAEHLNVEVYTIHGFCLRVVSEFGGRLGLAPVFQILSQDETDDLFYECFEKVYRRSPLKNVEHRVDTYHRLCEKARELGPGARIEDCGGDSGSLQEFVRQVLSEFELSKKSRRVLEYGDMEQFAVRLLEEPSVRETLRSRYSHVFVDEFQDTSEVQCKLVNAITSKDSMLFVVGDAKQSIYRFRGADVKVFQEFVSHMPARKRLSANFRSHEQIIDAVNVVCAPIIDGYEPMLAKRLEKEPAPAWSKVPRVARVTGEADADAIEAILRRLRAEGVDWSDVVILTRRMRGNEKLFGELAKRGIAVAATSSTSASLDDRLGKLLNLWVWVCEPWQRLRGAQVIVDFPWAFRTDTVGTERDLRRDLRELLESLESPYRANTTVSCEGLLAGLAQKFDLHQRFGSTFEQFKMFVLRHQSEGKSPSQLARHLDRLLLNEEDVSGFVLLPPPSNLSGTVRALTVHSSKGLEFPVVILADVKDRRSQSSSFFARGRELWLPARDEKGGLDWSREDLKAAREEEARDQSAESARLLYVAMTRAQEALYVVDRPEPPQTDEAEKKKAKRSNKPDLSWSAWLKAGIAKSMPFENFAGAEVMTAMARQAKAGNGAGVGHAALDPLSRVMEAGAPAYARARLGVSELAASLAADQEGHAQSEQLSLLDSAKPRNSNRARLSIDEAKQLGTDIHRFLELGDWDALRARAKELNLDLSPFWSWLKTETGQAVFALGQSQRVFNEFAFEWATGQGTVTGRLDRLVVFENAAWVIDYKIILGSRSKADLLATYSPQLRIYAEAVKTLTKLRDVRAFLIDVAAATGQVWHEVDCATSPLC